MSKREKDQLIYDEIEKTYTKIINPRLNKKIKYFFKLRRYPGENVKYISELFLQNGIKTFEVIEANKYKTVTKEVVGKTLTEELENTNNSEKINRLIEKYVDIVSKIIKLDIYFGDFNYYNFIVNEKEELIVIDLEDYRKDFFSKFRKKEMMKRLKAKLIYMQNIMRNKNENLNGEKIYLKIEEKLKNMI